jgi:hypothetical protein
MVQALSKLLPPAPTEFEAASVKPNKSGAQMRRIQPKAGGRIEIENIPLKMLIGLLGPRDSGSLKSAKAIRRRFGTFCYGFQKKLS